jgi:hypothetical protein
VEVASSRAAARGSRCALSGESTRRGADGRAPFAAGKAPGAAQVWERTVATSGPRCRDLRLGSSLGRDEG